MARQHATDLVALTISQMRVLTRQELALLLEV